MESLFTMKRLCESGFLDFSFIFTLWLQILGLEGHLSWPAIWETVVILVNLAGEQRSVSVAVTADVYTPASEILTPSENVSLHRP